MLDASLPRQPQHVAAVLAGLRERRGPWGPGRRVEAADAFEAVRIIARASGIDVRLRAAQYLPWHPGRCAEVLVGETPVGHAGQLHPAVIERSGLPQGTCAVELNLDAIPIVEALPAPRVSPFPAVFQDVSLVVAAQVAAQAVADAVREGAGELLEDLQLFDVFTGPQIGEDSQIADIRPAVPGAGSHTDRRRRQCGSRCCGATRRRGGRRRTACLGARDPCRCHVAGSEWICKLLHNHAESSKWPT